MLSFFSPTFRFLCFSLKGSLSLFVAPVSVYSWQLCTSGLQLCCSGVRSASLWSPASAWIGRSAGRLGQQSPSPPSDGVDSSSVWGGVWRSDDSSKSPFSGQRCRLSDGLSDSSEAEWLVEDGEVSVQQLVTSVECDSLDSSSVSLDVWSLSFWVCSVVLAVCVRSGCSASPESRVWQRPRGRSLSRGPAARLPEGLLTSTVSPRLNRLLSGFTCREKWRLSAE